MKQIRNRVGNGKEAVAMYQRREIIIQVEEAIAVDIDEVGSLPARNVKRAGLVIHRDPRDPGRKHRGDPFEEMFGPRPGKSPAIAQDIRGETFDLLRQTGRGATPS
ncbi:hypothetical protein ACOJBM_22995 [Rhizobium beringeri]